MLRVINTLYSDKWVSLMQFVDPENNILPYTFSQETRCQGRIVLVLPFRVVREDEWEYLVKIEITPCWSLKHVLSGITGGYEGGDIEDDAVREVLEETGYTITREELIPLGTCYASKSADTVYSLFSVDLTDKIQGEALGDGEELEQFSKWLDDRELAKVMDAQVHVAWNRLRDLTEMSRLTFGL
jgi:ADP-ribose pyrophosphatase YjhB (NUDIX family)